jgi:hypothetical protein
MIDILPSCPGLTENPDPAVNFVHHWSGNYHLLQKLAVQQWVASWLCAKMDQLNVTALCLSTDYTTY